MLDDDCFPEGAFWAEVAGRGMHPTQIQIIEAMRWIALPLSSAELARVFERQPSPLAIVTHLRRLARAGILDVEEVRQLRGTPEPVYRLFADSPDSGF